MSEEERQKRRDIWMAKQSDLVGWALSTKRARRVGEFMLRRLGYSDEDIERLAGPTARVIHELHELRRENT